MSMFGRRLRMAREAAKMSQGQLAEHCSVSKPTVWAWENGRTHPVEKHMASLAALFGKGIAAPDDLIEIELGAHLYYELIGATFSAHGSMRDTMGRDEHGSFYIIPPYRFRARAPYPEGLVEKMANYIAEKRTDDDPLGLVWEARRYVEMRREERAQP